MRQIPMHDSWIKCLVFVPETYRERRTTPRGGTYLDFDAHLLALFIQLIA
jgi:hypothetical protein